MLEDEASAIYTPTRRAEEPPADPDEDLSSIF
jgi:hypothetical protein